MKRLLLEEEAKDGSTVEVYANGDIFIVSGNVYGECVIESSEISRYMDIVKSYQGGEST